MVISLVVFADHATRAEREYQQRQTRSQSQSQSQQSLAQRIAAQLVEHAVLARRKPDDVTVLVALVHDDFAPNSSPSPATVPKSLPSIMFAGGGAGTSSSNDNTGSMRKLSSSVQIDETAADSASNSTNSSASPRADSSSRVTSQARRANKQMLSRLSLYLMSATALVVAAAQWHSNREIEREEQLLFEAEQRAKLHASKQISEQQLRPVTTSDHVIGAANSNTRRSAEQPKSSAA